MLRDKPLINFLTNHLPPSNYDYSAPLTNCNTFEAKYLHNLTNKKIVVSSILSHMYSQESLKTYEIFFIFGTCCKKKKCTAAA